MSTTRFKLLRALIVCLAVANGCGADDGSENMDVPRPNFGKGDDTTGLTFLGDLAFGDETTETFDTDGQMFSYGLAATPGAVITLDITQKGSTRGLDTSLFLFGRRDGEAWREVTFDDASGFGELSRIHEFALPAFADYLIVVGTESGRARGTYRMEVRCDEGDCSLEDLALRETVPHGWKTVLDDARDSSTFDELELFLEKEYAAETVYPPKAQIFNALELTTFNNVRVVLLGQDPYHGEGQAHGLAFSVQDGVKVPPSLRNIFKELESDVGVPIPEHGNLTAWGKQGVLLLNTALTVREKSPASHAKKGWEEFTDEIIVQLNARDEPVVFLLWGGHAKKKRAMIDTSRHVVLEAAHPSPLSARNGFFGSKPFSQTNDALEGFGQAPIDWSLGD